MADPDYVLRLRRAKERIAYLDERIQRWDKGQVSPIFCEFDGTTNEHVFKTRKMQPLPDRLGLDIGECLFYLRSGLDYIAHRLGDTHRGPIAKTEITELRKPEFPIFGDRPPRLDEWTKQIGRAHPDAITLVENMQPYRSGDYTVHPLWVLNELHNVDKHRMLNPIVVSHGFKGAVETNARTLRARILSGGPLVDGGEIYRTRIEPVDPKLPHHVQVEYSVQPGFDDTPVVSYQPVIDWLTAIQEFIDGNVVAPLSPYL